MHLTEVCKLVVHRRGHIGGGSQLLKYLIRLGCQNQSLTVHTVTTTMYRLGHSKSDLTDIDTRGKIPSPKSINASEGEGFSQGCLCQLDHECCVLTDLGHVLQVL